MAKKPKAAVAKVGNAKWKETTTWASHEKTNKKEAGAAFPLVHPMAEPVPLRPFLSRQSVSQATL
jgi:hypothetical protein